MKDFLTLDTAIGHARANVEVNALQYPDLEVAQRANHYATIAYNIRQIIKHGGYEVRYNERFKTYSYFYNSQRCVLSGEVPSSKELFEHEQNGV